jgi:hypothetical protein
MTQTSGGEASCPECGRPVDPTTQQLCPHCHYPLPTVRVAEEPVARQPGGAESMPQVDVQETPVVLPHAVVCPQCGHPNPATRRRCEVCAAALAEVARPLTLPPGKPLPPPRTLRDTWPAVVTILALLAVGFVVAWLLTKGPTGRASSGASDAGLVAVPSAAISAQSSSTAPKVSGHAFSACEVLDQRPTTVWLSGPKSALGSALLFTFTASVDLKAITIVAGDGASELAHRQYGAPTTLVVITDRAKSVLTPTDTSSPQTLPAQLGATRHVVLKVAGIRTGRSSRSVAISDVRFLTAQGAKAPPITPPVSCPEG